MILLVYFVASRSFDSIYLSLTLSHCITVSGIFGVCECHVKLPADKVNHINKLKLFDAFFFCYFVCCSLYVRCSRPVNTMKSIHHHAHSDFVHTQQKKITAISKQTHKIKQKYNNHEQTATTKHIKTNFYFLYFDCVPFFFFIFDFHHVISGSSFQFEFSAGNLHEYNDSRFDERDNSTRTV